MRLYSNCKITQGFLRDIIIDLERGSYYFAPKYLREILCNEIKGNDFEIDDSDRQFLIEKQLVFDAHYPFSKDSILDNSIHCSSIISNCSLIIEDTEINETLFLAIIGHLEELGCKALQIIGSPLISESVIFRVLSLLDNSKIRSIEIAVSVSIGNHNAQKFSFANNRVTFVLFYDSDKNDYFFIEDLRIWAVNSVTTYADLFTQKIEQHHFVCNITFYIESMHVNPFYYKKLSIDSFGRIYDNFISKNIIGLFKKEVGVQDILANSANVEYSTVNKELIDVCKHCEFKNICPDNRIPQKRLDGSWYHITECNYNPYLAKWKGEEGYATSEEFGFSE